MPGWDALLVHHHSILSGLTKTPLKPIYTLSNQGLRKEGIWSKVSCSRRPTRDRAPGLNHLLFWYDQFLHFLVCVAKRSLDKDALGSWGRRGRSGEREEDRVLSPLSSRYLTQSYSQPHALSKNWKNEGLSSSRPLDREEEKPWERGCHRSYSFPNLHAPFEGAVPRYVLLFFPVYFF